MKNFFGWLYALQRLNLREGFADRGSFLLLSIFMAINNVMWLGGFGLFFHVTGSVHGWNMADTSTLFGLSAFSFGLGFTLCGGALRMARPITEGGLDIYLGRPRPVLIGFLLRRIEATAIGDVVSGIIIIFIFGHVTIVQGMMALALGILGAAVFVAAGVAIGSLAFWSNGRTDIVDQLLDTMIGFSTMPLHGLPVPIRVILFTMLPAGFVAFLPADIVRHFAWDKLAAMVGAAIVFPALAVIIFHRGLRRYASGNRMVDGR